MTSLRQQVADAKETLHRLAAAVEASSDGIALVDAEGRFTYVNPAMLAMYGFDGADQLLGRSWRLLYEDAELTRFDAEILPQFGHAGRWSGEAVGRRRDGTTFPQEISMTALPGGGLVCIDRDISEQKRLAEQLHQAQKMEAIGRLAGGIAHDFNNILTTILGAAEMTLVDMSVSEAHRADLEDIRKAAHRAAALTQQLLAFSRKQVLKPQVLDLNELVGDAERLLRRVIGEDIALDIAAEGQPATVRADAGRLHQVIMNLAVNARDAMPQGGRLTIATTTASVPPGRRIQGVTVQAGDYVVLAVADTGVGMDPETRLHLFEPFFTTKGPGQGTGLGLATVYGIVTQSGGYVFVESERGRGTTFQVYLPLVEEVVPGPSRISGEVALGGNETVLLVEDDAAVRGLAARMLERNGYTVLEAATATDALTRAREHDGPLHLLLTDIVMPGASGRELAEALGGFRPQMDVLFMSGYTNDAIVRHGLQLAHLAYLEKPFTTEELLVAVRRALSRRPQPA